MTGPDRARRRSRWLIGAALGCLLLAGLAYLFVPRSSDEIEAVADSFAVPGEWTLDDAVLHAPGPLCGSDTGCPYVGRSWSVPSGVTATELARIIDRSGWSFDVTGTCVADPGTVGARRVCSAAGSVDGYAVAIAVRDDARREGSRVNLAVAPR